MNIIRLVERFPPLNQVVGFSAGVYNISVRQASRGNRVFVICKSVEGQSKSEEIADVTLFRVGAPFNLNALLQIAALQRKVEIDVVHSHATACALYPFLKHLLWNGSTVKHVVHVHGTTKGILASWEDFKGSEYDQFHDSERQALTTFRESLVWRRADAVIAVSEAVGSELADLYDVDESRIHIVHNGVDLNSFHRVSPSSEILTDMGLDRDDNVILYLGGFRPVKGPMVLIKAMDLARKAGLSFKALMVAGDLDADHTAECLSSIRQLGLDGIVTVERNIPHNILPQLYSFAKVVVVPSFYDSFPKVSLEAMACGTPVIGTEVGGMVEILRGDAGILVKPGDPVELAENIAQVLSNPSWAEGIGERGRQRVVETFSWDSVVDQIMQVYEKVIQE